MDTTEEKTKELYSRKTKLLFSQNKKSEENMEKGMTENHLFSPVQKSKQRKNTFIADWQVYEKVLNETNK